MVARLPTPLSRHLLMHVRNYLKGVRSNNDLSNKDGVTTGQQTTQNRQARRLTFVPTGQVNMRQRTAQTASYARDLSSDQRVGVRVPPSALTGDDS